MMYHIDGFQIDSEAFELRNGGAVAPIEPMALSLIIHLLENRARIVTRDELVERIWSGRSVTDAAISSCVKTARHALNDDGKAQRLIRTIHGRGFRFVGDVSEGDASSAARESAAPVVSDSAGDVAATETAQTAPTVPAAILTRPAVIVLPIRNATEDKRNDYLADGLTDDLISALSAWRWFPVISRNTSFQHRDANATAAQIYQQTGARYILSGDISTCGSTARVSMELMDAESGHRIWSSRTLRDVREMFSIQDELASSIVNAIVPELRSAEVQRVLRKSTIDMTAWDHAMRATWHVNRWTDADFIAAERYANAAADADPAWGYPQSLAAFIAFQKAMMGWSTCDARTAFRETHRLARAALEVDEGSWMGHALCAVGELWANGAYERALRHMNRALELNPSASSSYHFCGCISGFAGDLAAAITHQETVFQLDPAYPFTAVVESDLSLWRMLSGQFDKASAHLERAIEWDPTYARAVQREIALHGLRGAPHAAQGAIEKLSRLPGNFDRDYFLTSYPFRNPDHREMFLQGLRRGGLNLA